ncbi:MAG: ABC transporter ATP-binding protein [Bacteroidales bacterium]|nr:ABC transporter ATP-binding protein [Bacteroidales bacterium]MDY5193874.1 ABC transporter ATP-binding protein [Candidatus Aphodosoma sp.]
MVSEILQVNNVYKQYANHLALNNVSITVPRGEIFGLLGPNGAGKTTLIRIINNITAPDKGEVLFDGKKLSEKDIYRIGYLPEERGLYKKMKVGDEAMYLCRLKGVSKSDAQKKLKYWFEKFKIESWWNKKVEELSKGMAQKIQFITTVLHEPELLIFDEPFSGFDPVNADIIKQEILELKKKGTTIIFSTHNMESVEQLCDNIALINKSEVVLTGRVNEIKKSQSTNTYHIECTGIEEEDLKSFTVGEIKKIISSQDMLSFDVKLNEEISGNSLLSEIINKNGNITKFVEVLPSMNDIFIKTVKK